MWETCRPNPGIAEQVNTESETHRESALSSPCRLKARGYQVGESVDLINLYFIETAYYPVQIIPRPIIRQECAGCGWPLPGRREFSEGSFKISEGYRGDLLSWPYDPLQSWGAFEFAGKRIR